MQRFVAYDGSEHPVRDGFNIWPEGWSEAEETAMLAAWRADQPPPFAGREGSKAFTRWVRRMQAWAQGLDLTPRQRLLLDAWTNRNNINKALAWIAPHDYRDFGFETACQIHGNNHQRPCGCSFDLVFDHHKRDGLTDWDMHPFRERWRCETHGRLNSLAARFWTSAWDSGQPEMAAWVENGKALEAKNLLAMRGPPPTRGDAVSSADDLHRLIAARDSAQAA